MNSVLADIGSRRGVAAGGVISSLFRLLPVISQANVEDSIRANQPSVGNHRVRKRVPHNVVHGGLASGLDIVRVVNIETASQGIFIAESLIDSRHPLISVQNIGVRVDVIISVYIGIRQRKKYLGIGDHRGINAAGRNYIPRKRSTRSYAIQHRRARRIKDDRSRITERIEGHIAPELCRRRNNRKDRLPLAEAVGLVAYEEESGVLVNRSAKHTAELILAEYRFGQVSLLRKVVFGCEMVVTMKLKSDGVKIVRA